MESYRFHNPTNIHFGCGRLTELGALARGCGESCLLVTAPRDEAPMRPLYERALASLHAAGLRVTHFDGVVPNPTIASVEQAMEIVRSENLRVVIAVGGGSSIDTAKAIALFYQQDKVDWHAAFAHYDSPFVDYPPIASPALPVIAVPTTAGTGSEMTQAMILSDPAADEKACIFHPDAFPRHAIIDPELTLSMPPRLTAITGFDAFSHAFESLMRKEASAYTRMLSLRAIQDILFALPRLMDAPEDIALRETMSQAAMLAGIALSNAAATIPHPLSEVIGGIAPRIAHGQALACLYPSFLRFQSKKTPAKCASVARMLDERLEKESDERAAEALSSLIEGFLEAVDLRRTLTQLGVTDTEKEKMCGHFLLGVLPFGMKEELTSIMREAF